MASFAPDDINVADIYWANLPYLWLTAPALAITMFVPGLRLWLPSLMGN